MQYAEMNDEDKAELKEYMREAAYHLAALWDAMRRLEALTGGEVESSNNVLGLIAGESDIPAAYPPANVPDEELMQEFLDEVASSDHSG